MKEKIKVTEYVKEKQDKINIVRCNREDYDNVFKSLGHKHISLFDDTQDILNRIREDIKQGFINSYYIDIHKAGIYKSLNAITNNINYFVYINENIDLDLSKYLMIHLHDTLIIGDKFKFKNNEYDLNYFKKLSRELEENKSIKMSSIKDIEKIDYFKGIINFDQKNPYHTKDLLNHSLDTVYGLYNTNKFNAYDSVLLGLFHDIGKLYSQAFKDDFKTHANYIGHENVSGYIAIEYNLDIRIIKIIYSHMLMMNYHTSKKIKKLIDNSKYNQDLILFNQCDKDM